MNKQKRMRAGWIVAAVVVALAAPLAAEEASPDHGLAVRLIARVIGQLRAVVVGDTPSIEDPGTRSAHHLTIEPGGEPLPPPPADEEPPIGG